MAKTQLPTFACRSAGIDDRDTVAVHMAVAHGCASIWVFWTVESTIGIGIRVAFRVDRLDGLIFVDDWLVGVVIAVKSRCKMSPDHPRPRVEAGKGQYGESLPIITPIVTAII